MGTTHPQREKKQHLVTAKGSDVRERACAAKIAPVEDRSPMESQSRKALARTAKGTI